MDQQNLPPETCGFINGSKWIQMDPQSIPMDPN